MRDFKELIVWQKAKELVVFVYALTKFFPKNEQFGLISQITRATVSIVSNIAEGCARQHTKEYIQFLYLALGSAAELETQLVVSQELGYLAEDDLAKATELLKDVQKMLNGLIKSLRRRNAQ
ncbi:MAG: four helix bundle protein [bacterium]